MKQKKCRQIEKVQLLIMSYGVFAEKAVFNGGVLTLYGVTLDFLPEEPCEKALSLLRKSTTLEKESLGSNAVVPMDVEEKDVWITFARDMLDALPRVD